MTWTEIRKFYLRGCGETTEAVDEAWEHLTQGYRELVTLVDVEEVFSTGTLTVTSGDDSVSLSTLTDLYSLYTVFNVTTGERVDPEPAGMRGRSRYLEETTGQPASGTVYRWARKGGTLYVRGTADENTTLNVVYKIAPAALSSSDGSSSPVTPRHLDWPIIHLAISNYYAIHPVEGEDNRAAAYKRNALELIQGSRQPEQQENRDRREAVVQWGYDFN